MSAVRQQDFPLAIRFFGEARKAAPEAPEVLFNLGLAEAQVPGRELRSLCWFEAYLAVSASASNAAAIRQQISDLEVRAEGNVRKIIDTMKLLAGKFPAGDSYGASATVEIACTLARSGDLDGAIAMADSLPDKDRDNARRNVVGVLARMDRLDDARKLAGSIGYDDPQQGRSARSDAYWSIAQKQISLQQFPDARQSIGCISTVYLLGEAAKALAAAGSREDAMAVLADFKQKMDKSQSTLETLVKVQAALGLREETAETLKRIDATLPKKASLSNNFSIHNALLAHLDASDIAGAKALLPRLIDDRKPPIIFLYKTEAAKSIKEAELRSKNAVAQSILDECRLQREKIRELSQSWDLDKAESLLDNPAIPAVFRIRIYGELAELYRKVARLDRLPDLLKKAEAAFPGIAADPLGAPAAAHWIAGIADAASETDAIQKWRIKSVQSVDPLLQKSAQDLDSGFEQIYGHYRKAEMADDIFLAALGSNDDKVFQAGVDACKRLASKMEAAQQGRLASRTLWRYWLVDGDYEKAAAFIKSIPDEKTRQQAMDRHHELQFGKMLAAGELAGARRMLDEISDAPSAYNFQKSDKSTLMRDLSEAFADEGDWGNAQSVADGIKDAGARESALNHMASSRADGQANQQSYSDLMKKQGAAKWHEKKASLAALTKPDDRLTAYRGLCCGAVEGLEEEQRGLIPDYFAEANALPGVYNRLNNLDDVARGARSLGLFEIDRHARALAFSGIQGASGTTSAINLSSYFLNPASLADYIEQASIRWHDQILLKAIDRLKSDENPAAAVRLVEKLSTTDETVRNRILVELWCAQDKPAEARAAFDRIGKDTSANGYAKSDATRALVRALIKSGDNATARTLFEETKKLRDNESTAMDMIADIGAAGETDWARENIRWIASASSRNYVEASVLGAQAAKNNDIGAARALLKKMQQDSYPYSPSQYRLIDAVIAAGNPKMALALIPELSDVSSRSYRRDSAIMAIAKSGDIASAKKAAEEIRNNARRYSIRCQIASLQGTNGDLDGKRATLLEARKLDPRTAADLDATAWANRETEKTSIYNLLDKTDFAAAQVAALKTGDETERNTLLSSIVYSAVQKKNHAAALSALAAISDAKKRSATAASAVDFSKDPSQIPALIDQINDPAIRVGALGRAINKAVSIGNVSPLVPVVTALPDGPAKAYLLADLLRAKIHLGLDTGTASLLPLALKALSAMPPDVWHTLLLCDLARLAGQTDPAQARLLQGHIETAAQALTGADAAIWKQFLADAQSTVIEAQKPPEPTGSSESPARAWLYQLENYLNKPEFMDFKSALDSAANSAPGGAGNQSWTLFCNVQRLAEDLIEKMKDLREVRAKQAGANRAK